MRRTLQAMICAAFVLASHAGMPGEPQATDCETIPTVLSKELFDDLIGWIALNTSYDLLQAYQEPATVSFCDIEQSVAYGSVQLIVEKHLLAAYDVTRRHIYLVRPWSPVDTFDQSVLLHEMVHDIQWINRDWDCVGEPELEAYMLQDKWLVEQGVFHPFNWPAILDVSTCEPPR